MKPMAKLINEIGDIMKGINMATDARRMGDAWPTEEICEELAQHFDEQAELFAGQVTIQNRSLLTAAALRKLGAVIKERDDARADLYALEDLVERAFKAGVSVGRDVKDAIPEIEWQRSYDKTTRDTICQKWHNKKDE